MTKEERELIKYHIKNHSPVEIYYNNDTGVFYYSVQVLNTELWLDSFKTKVEAINFCNKYNLPIIGMS